MRGIDLVEAARLAMLTATDGAAEHRTRTSCCPGSPRIGSTPDGRALLQRTRLPRPFTRGVVACTGTEFCRFAVVETKERAVNWARVMDAELAGYPPVAAPRPGRVLGPAGRRRGDPHALLGLLGLVRPAPDRRHRVPGRHRPRGRSTSRKRSTSAWAGRSGPTPAFIDWVSGAMPVDPRVPEALVRVVPALPGRATGGRALLQLGRRTPVATLRAVLEGTEVAEPAGAGAGFFAIVDANGAVIFPEGEKLSFDWQAVKNRNTLTTSIRSRQCLSQAKRPFKI